MEKRKNIVNNLMQGKQYFWRTYDKKEIDLVEERNNEFSLYEIKYSPDKSTSKKAIEEFESQYTVISKTVINKDNFIKYLIETNEI